MCVRVGAEHTSYCVKRQAVLIIVRRSLTVIERVSGCCRLVLLCYYALFFDRPTVLVTLWTKPQITLNTIAGIPLYDAEGMFVLLVSRRSMFS
jgi:hypothetical protein